MSRRSPDRPGAPTTPADPRTTADRTTRTDHPAASADRTAAPASRPVTADRPTTADREWKTLLARLLTGHDLQAADAQWAMERIIHGAASPVQIGAFLTALRAKGETAEEIDGLVRALEADAATITVPGTVVDVVGTGGDGADTVNLSTMAAIVVAATGVTVVKHGGRAASSACGSADVLEHLGVRADLDPSQVAQVAENAGITFCLAPRFHRGLRAAAPIRRELGVPTVFNVLAPLLNPARPRHLAVGAADLRLAPVLADVLARRGASALVFRDDDGLDELTTTTTSTVWLVRDGQVTRTRLDPRQLDLPMAPPGALHGGDSAHNADVVRRLLAGEPGPVRDAVLLNAAAALVALDESATPLLDAFRAAMGRCADAVDAGHASAVLDRWIAACRQVTSTDHPPGDLTPCTANPA